MKQHMRAVGFHNVYNRWFVLQRHTVTYCNPLQRIAAHCNTLQHTATHCNTCLYLCRVQEATYVCCSVVQRSCLEQDTRFESIYICDVSTMKKEDVYQFTCVWCSVHVQQRTQDQNQLKCVVCDMILRVVSRTSQKIMSPSNEWHVYNRTEDLYQFECVT